MLAKGGIVPTSIPRKSGLLLPKLALCVFLSLVVTILMCVPIFRELRSVPRPALLGQVVYDIGMMTMGVAFLIAFSQLLQRKQLARIVGTVLVGMVGLMITATAMLFWYGFQPSLAAALTLGVSMGCNAVLWREYRRRCEQVRTSAK